MTWYAMHLIASLDTDTDLLDLQRLLPHLHAVMCMCLLRHGVETDVYLALPPSAERT